jgi:hypothetical protein
MQRYHQRPILFCHPYIGKVIARVGTAHLFRIRLPRISRQVQAHEQGPGLGNGTSASSCWTRKEGSSWGNHCPRRNGGQLGHQRKRTRGPHGRILAEEGCEKEGAGLIIEINPLALLLFCWWIGFNVIASICRAGARDCSFDFRDAPRPASPVKVP